MLALPLAGVLSLATGCESAGHAASTPGAPLEGDPGCVSSDSDRQCLGLKIAAYQDSKGQPTMSQEDAVRVVQEINELWKPCNIAFQVEEYEAVKPGDFDLSYSAGSGNETTEIRAAFSTPRTLLVAATGPWSTSAIAWTQMPGTAPYGTIVSRDYAKDAITVGHELGHYMGLDHSGSTDNLLYPVVYRTSRELTKSQCEAARSINADDWKAMLRHAG
jgi:hypothetical protein